MILGRLITVMGVDDTGLVAAQGRLIGLGRTARRVGMGMTMALTLPLAALGAKSISEYAQFQDSMQKIVGLVGVSQKQVGKWSKSIINYSAVIGRSPKKLADAMFYITSAGIFGNRAMELLKASARGSVSGMGSVVTIADLATSAMNAYGQANLSSSQALDVLTETVRKGKAEADSLAQSMGFVIPSAAALGVKFRMVGAAMAAMTRSGANASTSATQLRMVFATLMKNTPKVVKGFKAMGIPIEMLRKKLREPGGFLDVLKILKSKMGEFGNTVMAEVFPRMRALTGVLQIIGANAQTNFQIFADFGHIAGVSMQAFLAQAKSIKHQWDIVKSSFSAASTIMGQSISAAIMPHLVALGKYVFKLAHWFEGLNKTWKKTILTLGGIAIAAGPLLLIFGFFVSSLIPKMIAGFYGVARALTAMKIAMLKNPLMILLVVGASIVAFLYQYFSNLNKIIPAQKKVNEELEKFKKLTKSFADIKTFQQVIGDMTKTQISAQLAKIKAQIKGYEDLLIKQKITELAVKKEAITLKKTIADKKVQEISFQNLLTRIHSSTLSKKTISDSAYYSYAQKAGKDYLNKNENNYKTFFKNLDSLQSGFSKKIGNYDRDRTLQENKNHQFEIGNYQKEINKKIAILQGFMKSLEKMQSTKAVTIKFKLNIAKIETAAREKLKALSQMFLLTKDKAGLLRNVLSTLTTELQSYLSAGLTAVNPKVLALYKTIKILATEIKTLGKTTLTTGAIMKAFAASQNVIANTFAITGDKTQELNSLATLYTQTLLRMRNAGMQNTQVYKQMFVALKHFKGMLQITNKTVRTASLGGSLLSNVFSGF